MKGTEELLKSRPGSIVPLYETMPFSGNACDFFAKISDYGRKKNCVLLESADVVTKYGEKSIGSAEPCLKARGKGERFEVIALSETGGKFLKEIAHSLDFCSGLKITADKISGSIKIDKGTVSESERLKRKTHADVLRAIAFRLKPAYKPFVMYGGLIGAIGYDFIDNFEELPKNRKDVLKEPDYEMNFYDNLFIVEHKKNEISFVCNALIFSEKDMESEEKRCTEVIDGYRKMLDATAPKPKPHKKKKISISSDTPKKEFVAMVERLKKHVLIGDVFQVVPSRTMIAAYSAEPLDIYNALRELNPSPYMFYFNNSSGILLGSSPETFLKVEGDERKKVEIRPIAGTKPRGIINGKIDLDLDSRYEAELKNDEKEMAEHTMLIDLARNDVARVCEPGTRHCDRPYMIEKYSHVQHLMSNVSGILKSDLDALHAYLASMNMGTLTGAPKVEAMKLIRLHEKTRRGFYGGSIGYLTPSGDFDSAIVIRSMSLQKGRAYVRAGAGIVFDSVPEKEFEETEKKAKAALRAIEIAEGLE
ncbi:MAG: anthranilate synthase component 1 [archaeon]